MNEWWMTVLYGVVEGITEFLPISSTGHLVLLQEVTGETRSELFNVGIQAGAVLAVVLIYWKRLWSMVFSWRSQLDYTLKCMLAFTITAILGLVAKALGFELEESNLWIVWLAVMGGAGLIFFAEWKHKHSKIPPLEVISWNVATVMGVMQVVAGVLPGTSRSVATIMVALLMGVSRSAATEFSFLIGIPTMFAATGYLLFKERQELAVDLSSWMHLGLGFFVSLVVAFMAVKWLLHFIRSHTFVPFAWYRLGLGLLILAWILT